MLAAKASPLRANAPIEAKFGLHYQGFGTLPTLSEWEDATAYINTHAEGKWIALDITEELAILRHASRYAAFSQPLLAITVPTLGFTDPAFDYDIRPWFLTPARVNGFIAENNHVLASRPAYIEATDIAGNRYPVLFNAEGGIDYEAIGKEVVPGAHLFTTLESITYMYHPNQLFSGEGLYHGLSPGESETILFFPPPKLENHYSLNVAIVDNHKQILQTREVILPGTHSVPEIVVSRFDTQLMDREGEAGLGQLAVQLNMHTHQDALPTCFHYDFTLQTAEGLHQFSQYYGLSEAALEDIIEVILPQDRFMQNHLNLSQDAGLRESSDEVMFNYYQEHPEILGRLYHLVIEGVASKTIPLYALAEHFSPAQDIANHLLYLPLETWGHHDSAVFEGLRASMNASDPMLAGFDWVDNLDRVLSSTATDMDINLTINNVQREILPEQIIEASMYINDGQHDTPVFILSKMMSMGSDDFLMMDQGGHHQGNSMQDLITTAEELDFFKTEVVHKISLGNILQGGEIIEAFGKHDKLDISELLVELKPQNINYSYHITDAGNTQLYLHHILDTGESQTYNIATFTGMVDLTHLPDLHALIVPPDM